MMFLLICSPVYPLTHPLNATLLSKLTYTYWVTMVGFTNTLSTVMDMTVVLIFWTGDKCKFPLCNMLQLE